MTFYDISRSLYLEIDASGVSLGAGLLQLREGMNCGLDEVLNNVTLCSIAFSSKCLSCAEWWYYKIIGEPFGILHGLERFHHYCFSKEVCVIMDHKPLVVMVGM